MTPAPALNCSQCGRRLGKTAGHYLTPWSDGVVCGRCVEAKDKTRDPATGYRFDAYRDVTSCTRAGAAAPLGLWGKGIEP